MNPILAALLNSPAVASASSASTSSPQTQTSALANAGSVAQFKSQFDQAVATLANAAAPARSPQGSRPRRRPPGQPATPAADSLVATLQKKIADLLAKGESVSDIVQQLAASLATSLAAQFGGEPDADPKPTANGLRIGALSTREPDRRYRRPILHRPSHNGFGKLPTLRRGYSVRRGNRIDYSQEVSRTRQPPRECNRPPSTSGNPAPADSIAANASALFASLTATQSDGETVALNGAPALGSNGDTLLGRILARAAQPAPSVPAALQPQALASRPNRGRRPV